MTTTTTLAPNAYPLHHNNHMPSLKQVLILDHVATLLQYLTPHHASKADNDSVDVIDDRDIVVRTNELLEWYTACC